MKLFILFVSVFLIACNGSSPKHNVTIKKGSTIIKGDIDGAIFNDTILYYDLSDNLIRKSYFKDGKEEGVSTDFYRDGHPMIITHYNNGLRNGYNSYFDSSGKCYYRDYYYYNLSVGPIIYFDKNEIPKRFFFINLQNETLLDINYRDWQGVKDIYSKCINFVTNIQRVDTTHEVSTLLYLIKAPRLSFEYSILRKKKDSSIDFKEVRIIKSDMPFINITLPLLPKDEQYTVGLHIYDSLLSKRTVIYKDL